MVTEDYVSFEIAKLLKEKDFDWECCAFYVKSKECGIELFPAKEPYNYNNNVHPCTSAPTLQMAMKWLREAHNLVIEPYRTACGYLYTISSVPYGSTKYDNSEVYNGDDEDSGQWTTWEKACEDGIKYCLENLI